MAYLNKLWRPLVAAIIAACAVTPALAKPYCYAEAVAGGSLGANKLESGGSSVTIATDGYTAGLGAGCDYVLDRFVVGALARASLAKIDGTIDATKIKSDAAYMVGARAGFMVNGSTLVYALAGYQWQELQIPSVDTLDGKGLVLGAGLEFDVASGWRVGAEVNRTGLGTFGDGSGDVLKPVNYTGMLTLKYMFAFGQ